VALNVNGYVNESVELAVDLCRAVAYARPMNRNNGVRVDLPGLVAAREHSGLSLADVALGLGWTERAKVLVWRMEHGKRRASRDEARRLARMLKCKVATLIGGAP
jgi:ribosome-binding protein aMBF1 (putative translation factor)